MPDAVEITGVAPDFLVSVLSADATIQEKATGGVREITLSQAKNAAERDTMYPAVLIGPPVWEQNAKGNGNTIIWTRGRFEVTAIGLLHQIRTLEEIAGRFKPLLHGYTGYPPHGGYINSCDFIRPVRTPQTVGELTFIKVGGLYRIAARTSST
jgi:hypothetical protein